MKEYEEEDFLSLAGIQHFVFCQRQWALIHIENQWAENLRTIEGHILHEVAHDDEFTQKRGDMIVTRGMPVIFKGAWSKRGLRRGRISQEKRRRCNFWMGGKLSSYPSGV